MVQNGRILRETQVVDPIADLAGEDGIRLPAMPRHMIRQTSKIIRRGRIDMLLAQQRRQTIPILDSVIGAQIKGNDLERNAVIVGKFLGPIDFELVNGASPFRIIHLTNHSPHLGGPIQLD